MFDIRPARKALTERYLCRTNTNAEGHSPPRRIHEPGPMGPRNYISASPLKLPTDTGPLCVEIRITGFDPNSMRLSLSSQVLRASLQTSALQLIGECPSEETTTPD